MQKTIITTLIALVVVIGAVFLISRAHNGAETGSQTATSSVATTTATDSEASLPETGTVTLALGQTAAFQGLLITPTKVTEDSRCPAGVYCIQAGSLKVAFVINTTRGTTTQIITLGASAPVDARSIIFVSSDPVKKGEIPDTDYRFTLNVAP